MAVFEEVRFSWEGREYALNDDDQIMRLIWRLEEILPWPELGKARVDLPLGKIASCYALALRHAGAKVTDAEVLRGMFHGGEDLAERALKACVTLQALMIPPDHLKQKPGKPGAAGEQAGSSPSATGSSSDKAG